MAAILALVVLGAGCEVARAGNRCRAGSAPARDATHVLFCVKGRWKRTVTIGQAVQILLARPSSFVVEGRAPSATFEVASASDPPPAEVFVLRLTAADGRPVAGQRVLAGGLTTLLGRLSLSAETTDADGRVRVAVTPGQTAGRWTVRVSAMGLDAPVDLALENRPGPVANVTAVSGAGQWATVGAPYAAPVVVQATDRFGNATPGRTIPVQGVPPDSVVPSVSEVVTGPDGRAALTVTAGPTVPDPASPWQSGLRFGPIGVFEWGRIPLLVQAP